MDESQCSVCMDVTLRFRIYLVIDISDNNKVRVLSMKIYKKTTTLIFLVLQLVHHLIEGTGINTTDVNATTFLYCWYWYGPTVQLPVLLPVVSMEYTIFIMLRRFKQNSDQTELVLCVVTYC
jgi:hypothetical protein